MELANILKGRNRFLKPTTPSKRAEVYYREQLAEFIRSMVNRLIKGMRKANLTDAVDDDPFIDELITALGAISSESIEQQAKALAYNFTKKVQYQNKTQFANEFKNAFGVDMGSILEKERLGETLAKALTNNTNLISSIKNDFINDVGSIVFEQFKKGARQSDIIKSIYERGEVTYSRAKLIARDQTAKINADFEEERNRKLGFDVYKWKGAGDSRERHSHKVLNDMLCKYSDPTVYSDDGGKTWKSRKSIGAYIGNPGTDIQCRCLALPKITF